MGAALVLFVVVLVGFRVARPGALPGLEVAGEDVGGLSEPEVTATVAQLAEQRAAEQITTTLDVDREQQSSDPREALGYSVDVEETVRRAWSRGRQLNPIAALVDHFRAFGESSVRVGLEDVVDQQAFQDWVEETASALSTEPVEGTVEIDGDEVTTTLPEPGAEVDRDDLTALAAEAVPAPGEQFLEVASSPVSPETEDADVEAAAEDARRAVSGPVRLFRDEGALELSSAEIGDLLSVSRVDGEAGERLEIQADAEALSIDDETRQALETEPVDAQFSLNGEEVEITPSVEGFRFDAEVAAEQVLEVATAEDGDREAELEGRIEQPERTTEDAEELGITERVSSFTTHHACCQGRVQNIQRMADIVDGAVLEPGEEFSINEHVGRRTREKGFTGGGVIIRGEFEEEVGGGVSQFATTFFGAAYEGGYEILEHQPHSYYISRYPAGRESTINYPTIDVRIRNDSPYGMLINTRYTATSITVDVYGSQWVDVQESTSNWFNVRSAPVEYEENPGLAPGSERVVQSGRQGFDVTYSRTLDYHDGGSDEQSWTHRYRPEPRIIERNTSEPEPEDPDEQDNGDMEDDDSE